MPDSAETKNSEQRVGRAPVVVTIEIGAAAQALQRLRWVDYALAMSGASTALCLVAIALVALWEMDVPRALLAAVLCVICSTVGWSGWNAAGGFPLGTLAARKRQLLALLLATAPLAAVSGTKLITALLAVGYDEAMDSDVQNISALNRVLALLEVDALLVVGLISTVKLERSKLGHSLRVPAVFERLSARLNELKPPRHPWSWPRGWTAQAHILSGALLVAPHVTTVLWFSAKAGNPFILAPFVLPLSLPYLMWYLGIAVLVRSRRYGLASADDLLVHDRRAPVLFLRSFEDDGRQSYVSPNRALLDFSLETRLFKYFSCFGPFVAIGNPREPLALPGAARAQLPDDEWQTRVRDWIASAQVIVMYAGHTHWVNWELQQILTLQRENRLLLLFPEPRSRRKSKIHEQAVKRMVQVRTVFRGTEWEEELLDANDFTEVRGMIFRPDGSMVLLRSATQSRDSYQLAALLAHLLLLEPSLLATASSASVSH